MNGEQESNIAAGSEIWKQESELILYSSQHYMNNNQPLNDGECLGLERKHCLLEFLSALIGTMFFLRDPVKINPG